MPFIRKVRVLSKTRLIFPRINGPNDLTEYQVYISLQIFKKPLDIFSPQIERTRSKEFLVVILAVKEALSDFLGSSSSLKKANTGKPA